MSQSKNQQSLLQGGGVPFSIQYLNLNYSYSSSLPLHCGEGGGEYHFSLSRQVPNFWRSISNLSAFSHYSFYINKPSLARVFYQKSHFKLTSYQLYQKHQPSFPPSDPQTCVCYNRTPAVSAAITQRRPHAPRAQLSAGARYGKVHFGIY